MDMKERIVFYNFVFKILDCFGYWLEGFIFNWLKGTEKEKNECCLNIK